MSAPFTIPPRLRLFLRRHVPSILVLILLMPAHILLVHGIGGPATVTSGADFPAQWVWIKCLESAWIGEVFFSPRYLLVLGAGVFAALGVWRLTQNRLVSIASGALLLLHPLTVSAVATSAGLAELLAASLGAWAFCLHARPRHRSARYPNRRPSPFAWSTFAVCAAASLSTPVAWVIPALLIVMDLSFDRERGGAWFEREWSGYLKYALLLPVPLVLQAIGATSDSLGSFGPSQILSPRLADAAPFWLGLVSWPILLAALGCFLLDQLSRVGDHRTALRFVGFAGAWFFVSAVIGPILSPSMAMGGALLGLVGVAGGCGVLLFRLATRMDGEHQPLTRRHVSLAWRSAGHLPISESKPVPTGTYAPPVALGQTLDRLAKLKPIVDDHTGAPIAAERVASEELLTGILKFSDSVIEFSQAPSPHATFIASRVEKYTLLTESPQYREALSGRFDGLDGCSAVDVNEWMMGDGALTVDWIVAVGGLPADESIAQKMVSCLSTDGGVLTLADDPNIAILQLEVVETRAGAADPLVLARKAIPVSKGESV